jgi:hypothetical protein
MAWKCEGAKKSLSADEINQITNVCFRNCYGVMIGKGDIGGLLWAGVIRISM